MVWSVIWNVFAVLGIIDTVALIAMLCIMMHKVNSEDE